MESALAAPPSMVLCAVLERLDRAVLVVDSNAGVCFGNPAALRHVECGEVLALRGRRLAFTDADANARFERHLRARGQSGSQSGSMAELVIDARRAGGREPLRVVATAIASGSQWWVVLVIFDPRGPGQLSAPVLRAMYGLTDAEAALACRLYAGASPSVAARARGITLNTARSHLKHVFEKCQVHSQAELLKLLALGPGAGYAGLPPA